MPPLSQPLQTGHRSPHIQVVAESIPEGDGMRRLADDWAVGEAPYAGDNGWRGAIGQSFTEAGDRVTGAHFVQ